MVPEHAVVFVECNPFLAISFEDSDVIDTCVRFLFVLPSHVMQVSRFPLLPFLACHPSSPSFDFLSALHDDKLRPVPTQSCGHRTLPYLL
jgi:hypothetical protein